MFFVLITALPDCSSVSQIVPLVPILQDWHLASLTLDSWAGGWGEWELTPRDSGCPLSNSRNQGKENWTKTGTRRGGQPLCCPPPPGNNFASLTPPFPVPGSSSGPTGNRMWVGGDFPMVGALAPSPGRYKATSADQRNLDGKERGHHVLLEPRGKPEVGPHPAVPGQAWTPGRAWTVL